MLSALLPVRVQGQQRDTAAAARAFEEGQHAQLRGDHAQAAQLFELAHRAAPAPAAIRSAIRSHRAAGNDVRAATLALSAQAEYPADADTAALAARTIAELSGALVRLEVRCAEPCTLSTDGRLATLVEASEHQLFLRPGSHELVATLAGRQVARSLEADAGASVAERFEAAEPEPELAETEPPAPTPRAGREPAQEPAPAAATPEPGGLPPAFTFVGLGVSAALGAALVWSLVDTFEGSDEYEADPTREGWEDGQDRIRRTWLLGVSTALVGLGTILVATLATAWGGDDLDDGRVRLLPVIAPRAGGLSLEGAF